MTEVIAKAPRRPQTLHSRKENDTEAGSFGEILLRRPAVNHPEQAKRNRNTTSNTTSVPVGVKSKDILRVRSPAAISALSVAESYHTRKKICWIGSAGRSGQVERALLACGLPNGVVQWWLKSRWLKSPQCPS